MFIVYSSCPLCYINSTQFIYNGTRFAIIKLKLIMKKLLIALTFLFSIPFLQSCNNDDKVGKDDVVSVDKVPEVVRSTFSSRYGNATDVVWEHAHEDTLDTYKVKFKSNGNAMEAEFKNDGSFIKDKVKGTQK